MEAEGTGNRVPLDMGSGVKKHLKLSFFDGGRGDLGSKPAVLGDDSDGVKGTLWDAGN